MACFYTQTQNICWLWGCQIAPSPQSLPLPLLPHRLARVPHRCQAVEGIFFFFSPSLLHLVPQWNLQAVALADAFGWLPASAGLGCEGSDSAGLPGEQLTESQNGWG